MGPDWVKPCRGQSHLRADPVDGERNSRLFLYAPTASLVDAANQPVPNVTVTFTAVSGPKHRGRPCTAADGHLGSCELLLCGQCVGNPHLAGDMHDECLGRREDRFQPRDCCLADALGPEPLPRLCRPTTCGRTRSFERRGRAPRTPSSSVAARPTPMGSPSPRQHHELAHDDFEGDRPISKRPGPTWSLWGSFTIPANGSAILTQTAYQNFDTSDYGIVGCGGTVSATDKRVPKVTVTRAGQTAQLPLTPDTSSTRSATTSPAGATNPCNGGRSGRSWVAASGELLLAPATSTDPIGATATVTAIALDASSQPLPNVLVTFKVLSGPDTTKMGTATTDTEGLVGFLFDHGCHGRHRCRPGVVQEPLEGRPSLSNNASIVWIPTVSIALAPATATQALGTAYNATATVTDGNGQPVGNLARHVRGPRTARIRA